MNETTERYCKQLDNLKAVIQEKYPSIIKNQIKQLSKYIKQFSKYIKQFNKYILCVIIILKVYIHLRGLNANELEFINKELGSIVCSFCLKSI